MLNNIGTTHKKYHIIFLCTYFCAFAQKRMHALAYVFIYRRQFHFFGRGCLLVTGYQLLVRRCEDAKCFFCLGFLQEIWFGLVFGVGKRNIICNGVNMYSSLCLSRSFLFLFPFQSSFLLFVFCILCRRCVKKEMQSRVQSIKCNAFIIKKCKPATTNNTPKVKSNVCKETMFHFPSISSIYFTLNKTKTLLFPFHPVSIFLSCGLWILHSPIYNLRHNIYNIQFIRVINYLSLQTTNYKHIFYALLSESLKRG